jgi:hypothetical protein
MRPKPEEYDPSIISLFMVLVSILAVAVGFIAALAVVRPCQ